MKYTIELKAKAALGRGPRMVASLFYQIADIGFFINFRPAGCEVSPWGRIIFSRYAPVLGGRV
jgi:hypothetical protein